MYLFGGSNLSNDESSMTQTILNDMFCYNRKTCEWKKVICQHETDPRTNFSMLYLHSYVVAFGGTTVKKKYSNDLILLNVEEINSCMWNEINGKQTLAYWPKPRRFHAMCAYKKDSIILFGGESNEGEKLNDFWSLDVQKVAEYLQNSNQMTKMLWSRVQSGGLYQPRSRKGHSICSIDSFVYLLGGAFIVELSPSYHKNN